MIKKQNMNHNNKNNKDKRASSFILKLFFNLNIQNQIFGFELN